MKAILLLALALFASSSFADPRTSASSQGPPSSNAAVPVILGQSVVALYGPWKFHIGDNPQWADPAFNDSQWETVDLTPTPQTTVPGVPIPGFVTGWGGRGHSGYTGYAWYRIRVRISGAVGPLTLLGPEWFDGAFQVFANGRIVGSFGDFSQPVPRLYETHPARFPFIPSEYERQPDGSTLIAFRFYKGPNSRNAAVVGGMHGPPRLGLPPAADAAFHLEWEQEYRRLTSALAAGLLYFVFALLIAMIFAFNRTEKILLWPLSACVLQVVQFSLICSTSVDWISQPRLEGLIGFANLVSGYLWLFAWWAYFSLQKTRWLFNTILIFGIWNLATMELQILHPESFHALALWNSFVAFLVIATIAWLGWKRIERRQWALYLALFFYSFQVFQPVMSLLRFRTTWQPFGVLLPFDLLGVFLSLMCFSLVLFRQFRASLRRQQSIADDLMQAQEVQQLLIPDRVPQVRGWTIESEYRPAREVGGDFFQVLPGSDDSLLIVVGDVSGKGLKAAMTVSAIVGALRNEKSRQPAQLLASLNRVLCGQIVGFVTCSATLLAEDGSMTIANAGHLPPYRSGESLPVANGLPLGVLAETSYEEQRFELASGESLTFVSDGILEARNARGELLGFDRMAALATQPASAIAQAAQSWGQEDDITVLTVARSAKLETVTA